MATPKTPQPPRYHGNDYEYEALASPAAEKKPTHYGYLTTRVLHTEREPLTGDGTMTVGQMIDKRLADLASQDGFNGHGVPEGWVAPVVHSITLELPRDD